MLRQHQFEKVEMVSITRPEDSRAELDRMTDCAQNILESLNLPYRTVVLATGDMGFGARRTHDLEVWLPGQDTYREISSGLGLRRLPGPPDERPLPPRRGRAPRVRPHPERLRPRRRPHADRGPGERPGSRRLGHPARRSSPPTSAAACASRRTAGSRRPTPRRRRACGGSGCRTRGAATPRCRASRPRSRSSAPRTPPPKPRRSARSRRSR